MDNVIKLPIKKVAPIKIAKFHDVPLKISKKRDMRKYLVALADHIHFYSHDRDDLVQCLKDASKYSMTDKKFWMLMAIVAHINPAYIYDSPVGDADLDFIDSILFHLNDNVL